MAISPERLAEIQQRAEQLRVSGQRDISAPKLNTQAPEGLQGILGGAVGFGKKLLTKGMDTAKSGLDIGRTLGESPIGEAFGSAVLQAFPGQEEQIGETARRTQEVLEQTTQVPEVLRPKGRAEKTGATVEQIAEFAVPVVPALGATGKVAKGLQKFGKAAPVLGRGVEEAATGAAIGLSQEGNIQRAATGSLIDMGLAVGLGSIGRGIGAARRGVQRITPKITDAVPPLARGTQTHSLTQLPSSVAETAIGATRRVGQRIGEGLQNVKENIGQSAQEAARLSRDLPEIRQAITSGIPERFVRQITRLSDDNLDRIRKMQEIAEKESIEATGKRTKDVVGEVVANQMRTLREQAKDIGKRIDIVEKQGKIEPIAGKELHTKLDNILRSEGVSINKEGKIISSGRFSTDEAKLLRSLLDEIPFTGSLTAEDVINVKRRMRKAASSKSRQLKLETADINRVLNTVQRGVDEALPVAYRELAREYAQIMNVLGEWLRILGTAKNTSYSIDDLIEEGGALFGDRAMRTLGNAGSRVEGVLTDLVETAKQYGYEGADDILALTNWADIIEGAYGLTQRGSLQGRVSQADQGVIDTAITATSPPLGVVKKGIDFVTGQSGKNKQNAIEQLLNAIRRQSSNLSK